MTFDRHTRYAFAMLFGMGVCWTSLDAKAAEDASGVGISQQQPKNPHHVSGEICKNCHEKIYEQWKSSMHSQSTALKDPIHGAFYQYVMGSPSQEGLRSKKGQYPVCLNCHSPSAALDGKTDLTAMAAYGEGVNCVSCHLMVEYKGLEGPDGKLRLRDGDLRVLRHGPAGIVRQELYDESNRRERSGPLFSSPAPGGQRHVAHLRGLHGMS
jgi:hypothetical protein